MIYFDSDMSKSTNTVAYFDWKKVIYIYVCGKCRTQFMLPMEKSVAFTGACANEIIPIARLSTKRKKDVWYYQYCNICNTGITGIAAGCFILSKLSSKIVIQDCPIRTMCLFDTVVRLAVFFECE